MKKIVAIGGNNTNAPLYKINKYIVYLAQVPNPNFLFIPTASNDNLEYIAKIQKAFNEFNINFQSLNLCNQKYHEQEIRSMIDNADIIYVGGGNTKMMMEIWHKHHVDEMLINAYANGKVCCGLSAGAICWFKWGHSDSNSFNAKPNETWDFIPVNGLDLIHAAIGVHYDEIGRDGFDKMLQDLNNVDLTVAIENNNAIVILDDNAFIYSEADQPKAYLFQKISDHQYEKKPWLKDQNVALIEGK